MRGLILGFVAVLWAGPSVAQETAPSPAAVSAPVTIDTFAAPPSIEGPELSPNGQWTAAKLNIGGRQILGIMSLFQSGAKPVLVGVDTEKMTLDWWDWVNDDWLLIGVSANDSIEGDKFRVSRVLSIERASGKAIPLGWKGAAQDAADVIWTARDGTPRILLGIQNSIYSDVEEFWPEVREFDVSTGKSKLAQRRRIGIMDYYADGSGAVRLGYGYDSTNRTARLIYREGAEGSFRILDRANFEKEEKLSFPSLFLAEKGKALTVDDSGGFDAVYELDLATLRRGKKVFGVEGYDIDGLVRNATGDGLAGVLVTKNVSSVHWIDLGLAGEQALIDKAVGAGRARVVSWDQKREKLLVHIGGADQAGAYYYYDRTTGGSMRIVAYVDSRLKTRKLAPVTTIRYKARDGLEIPAVLTLPKGATAKNLPLILLPHGGPQARDVEGWDWMVQFLAWRGYAVVQPNYRGSTGFGKKFLEAGEGQWGLKMQDDLNDAVSHLAAQGVIDPKRVCIMGASYGGYAAMRAAQRDGDKFKCAISYAGVSDLARMSIYDSRFLYGREYSAHLKEQAPDYAAVSPLRGPAQFSTPILIMHGKLDLRVPVAQSREMADRLKTAGKPHRYVEQPLGDHHFTRQADRLQFLQEVEAFLAQHNPAG